MNKDTINRHSSIIAMVQYNYEYRWQGKPPTLLGFLEEQEGRISYAGRLGLSSY